VGIVTELKQRRLVQIVISYLAAGWVALEVVNRLVERAILPDVAYFVGLIWYLGGARAAVLIGWHHGEKGRQQAPRSEIAALVVLAIIAVGMSGFTVTRMSHSAPSFDLADTGFNPNRVAVLYLENLTGVESDQYMADGLTEALIEELDRVDALDVISRHGVQSFRGSRVPAHEVAAELEAGTVITGAIQRRGDRLVLDLELREGESGSVIHRISLSEAPDSLLAASDSVVAAVGRTLRQALGEEIVVRARARTTNQTAWTLVQRAETARKEAERLLHQDARAALDGFERARSLLAEAERADSTWVEPVILSGGIDYRLSRLYGGDPRRAAGYARAAMAEAERALAKDRRNARAFELRGTSAYWLFLLQVEADPDRQHALLERARVDLERAVQENARLASAYSTLSHLYYQTGRDVTQAVLAAQRAYQADAYLDVADGILWRLYNGQLDLGAFAQAARWCAEGARRFPRHFYFTACQLQLMTTPAADPDPERAWRLKDAVIELAPAPSREYHRLRAEFMVGGVLARAADAEMEPVRSLLADSATAVMDRARSAITHENDPSQELFWVEAYSRSLNGESDRAIHLLRRSVAANPDHAFGQGSEVSWWWRGLQDHPGFRDLLRH
jgi:TolB-like protein/tetratricopeptide (TPR) repeat protein